MTASLVSGPHLGRAPHTGAIPSANFLTAMFGGAGSPPHRAEVPRSRAVRPASAWDRPPGRQGVRAGHWVLAGVIGDMPMSPYGSFNLPRLCSFLGRGRALSDCRTRRAAVLAPTR